MSLQKKLDAASILPTSFPYYIIELADTEYGFPRKETFYLGNSDLMQAREAALQFAHTFKDWEGVVTMSLILSPKKSITVWTKDANTCIEGLEKEAAYYVKSGLIHHSDLVFILKDTEVGEEADDFGILPTHLNSPLFQTSQLKLIQFS